MRGSAAVSIRPVRHRQPVDRKNQAVADVIAEGKQPGAAHPLMMVNERKRKPETTGHDGSCAKPCGTTSVTGCVGQLEAAR